MYQNNHELPWARSVGDGEFLWRGRAWPAPAHFDRFDRWLEHYVEHVIALAPADLYPDGFEARA